MTFEQIYKEYYSKIVNYCYCSLKNRQLAEDCAQEVFLALFVKMHSLRLDTNIASWLYKAAQIEIKRCKAKIKPDISLDETVEIPISGFDEQDNLSALLTDEEYETLNEYYVLGESIDKMAAKRGISAAALYQRICRLKNRIKRKL